MRKTNVKALQNNRGVTLIALLVTVAIIIVLLSVGIKYAVNSDLIGHAEKAVQATNEREKEQLDQAESIMGRIDDIEKQQQIDSCGGHDFVDGKCSKCGVELVIGAPINYHEYIYDTSENSLSSGTPIKRTPTYTSTKAARGSTDSSDSDATYSVAENSGIEWIVLGEEENQIKITTKNIVQPTSGGYTNSGFTYLRLEGQAGYTNFVDELNKIGAVYGHGKYADTTKFTSSGGRSFKMEDLRYGTLTRTATYKYALEKHSGDTEAKVYRYAANETPDGTSTVGGECSTFKYMVLDASNSTQETEANHVWKELTTENPVVTMYDYAYSGSRTLDTSVIMADAKFWLASRGLDDVSGGVCYIAYYLLASDIGGMGVPGLFYSFNFNGYGDFSGVRPVVYLQSGIKLSYDATNGYTINE